MTIRCEIVTQERLVYEKDVDSINIPGVEGRMGILPNHSPLLTVLDFGEVITRVNGEEEYFAIGGGIAEVQPDKVIILADSAEHAEEIDEELAAAARQRAEQAMEEGVEEDPAVYEKIQASLRFAQLSLDVSRRRKRRRNSAIPDLSNTTGS